MFEFLWLEMFLLVPLPLLVRGMLSSASNENDDALRVPFFNDVSSLPHGMKTVRHSKKGKLFIMWLAWLVLLFAAARPQWVGIPQKTAAKGRNIVMAVDLSLSMEETDFVDGRRRINRLEVIKNVADKFIEKREGDRIGLVLFGERAYLQAPLTFDRKTVRQLLDEAEIGLAGKATAIGDAIGMTVKYLQDTDSDGHVLILLTDGANTAGVLKPLEAADIAAKNNIKIYTVGVGSGAYKVRTLFGTRVVNPSIDLDEKTLTQIAAKTGGAYFRAKNTRELKDIYEQIDKLEPVSGENVFLRPVKELFYYPLFLFMILGLLILWLHVGLPLFPTLRRKT